MAYDGAGGRQAVASGQVPGRGRARPAPATWPTGCAGPSLGVLLHEEAEQPLGAVEPPVAGEVVVVVGPEGGLSPRGAGRPHRGGRHGVPAGTDGAAHLDGGHRRGGSPAVPHPPLALTGRYFTVNVLVSTWIGEPSSAEASKARIW